MQRHLTQVFQMSSQIERSGSRQSMQASSQNTPEKKTESMEERSRWKAEVEVRRLVAKKLTAEDQVEACFAEIEEGTQEDYFNLSGINTYVPPEIISNSPEKMQLFKQACLFGLRPSVAAYAMVATGLRSVEAAMQFVYDADETTGKVAHTYIGYFRVMPSSEPRLKKNPDDNEALLQFSAADLGSTPEECYICSKPRSDHSVMLQYEDSKMVSVGQIQVDLLINRQSEAELDEPAAATTIERKMTIKDRATSIRLQMTATAKRLEEQLAQELAPEADYCAICYANEIKPGEISTVTLECDHSFCLECSIAQLSNLIENAEVDKVKCFDFECPAQISVEKLAKILADSDKSELLEKFQRFKAKKDLDSDPLVRYCPKPDCNEHMRGENQETVKLQCPKCATEVCFKCREQWHGTEVSCADAMDKDLQEWVDQNKGNVSFCPMCRTKIEKNKGCNHMTCVFCNYQFCWACGKSAATGENHFGDFGSGCGVAMMDENVKPGDHLNIKRDKCSKCKRLSLYVLKVLAFIILFPVILVFFLPCKMTREAYRRNRSEDCCKLFLICLGHFLAGLLLDIIFIPAALAYTMTIVFFFLVWLLYAIVTCRWLIWIKNQCKGVDENAAPSRAQRINEERARANIERRREQEENKVAS